ncbi:metal-dependent transcriptional regulator [Archaeoglobus fulgidus]|uniref:Mn-dependent transcriptional regulator n=2 Tax=Archaeoglobus fulgidus TaxID=2234 RepID=A0A075WAR3_ARCFL|nr:metal-dependent transcriptional regulator [Archaeoglobus fulgidus]AIG97061.1 Mn-dependent transcriptional regulator [Archaeoglobus fulgidus DSM 8774]KUJ94518.1 MAG: Iron-dependent repressor (DesR) [Archaeoglobus fulgidus]KUK07630.1 MAG: Iron-dependent repressor (DesR) [Archaeoglobus fulgidus]
MVLKLSETAENILRDVWMAEEEGKRLKVDSVETEALEELKREGLLTVDGGIIKLTDKGRKKAEKIVRLHRLAERLLSDILGFKDVEEHACKFEHLIDDEAEEAICTLLGHPQVCPHGRKIPQGHCCIEKETEVEKVIYRLSELSPGDEAEVKYTVADDRETRMLISAGIIPGVGLKVIRVYPAFVIQIENTQFALDKKLADAIYVVRRG